MLLFNAFISVFVGFFAFLGPAISTIADALRSMVGA